MSITDQWDLLNGTDVLVHVCALGCRQGNQSDAEWLQENFGPFSQSTAYSDLKDLNISVVSHTFHYQSSLKRAAQ